MYKMYTEFLCRVYRIVFYYNYYFSLLGYIQYVKKNVDKYHYKL